MLNRGDALADTPCVIDYANADVAHAMANGEMNTEEPQILANIASSIRRGWPQMRRDPNRPDRICLVGSGPSLADTWSELRQLVWEGATLVTLNGAYHYCLERNLRPQTQIVMDARPSNARFVQPLVPKCNYLLASQCAPEVWDAVDGRENVWIWHPVVKTEANATELLNRYYGGQWMGVGGGTTVASRAIFLLRTAGYLRYDLFGIDCCWMGDEHHALPQPENANDAKNKHRIRASVRGSEESREFLVSPWMLKQAEDFLTMMQINGKHFSLTVHGDGLLAYLMRLLATASVEDVQLTQETAHGSAGVQTL